MNHEVVLASAGSGKTFRLTNRLIALLARGVAPDRILAVTFTRKAAGEIGDRLLARLADAAADDDAARSLGEHTGCSLGRAGWAAVLAGAARSAHRLRILTLDAVAVGLAQAIGPGIGLAGGWTLASEHREGELRIRAIERWMDAIGASNAAAIAQRIAGVPAAAALDRTLGELLASGAGAWHADAWNCLASEVGGGPGDAALAEAATTIEAWPPPTTQAGTPNKRWAQAIAQLGETVRGSDWDAFLEAGLAKKVLAGEATFSRVDIPDPLRDAIGVAIEAARCRVIAGMHGRNRAAADTLAQLPAADAALRREAGEFALADLWRLLAEADLDGLHVAYRLDARLDHILIDEFQDTSLDQWRVLEPLLEEAVAGGERDRSVFVVGDEKQSLYSWRNAAAGLLSHVAGRWPQVEATTLRTTYRCAPSIVEAVNRVFGGLPANPGLADAADAAHAFGSVFEPHEAARSESGLVRISAVDASEEAQAVVEAAAARVAEIRRRRSDATIAVLVRTNARAAAIARCVADAGIPVVTDAAVSPAAHPAGEAVLAALRLAAHPGDAAALFSVATGPLARAAGVAHRRDVAGAARFSARVRRSWFEAGPARAVEALAAAAAAETNARGGAALNALVQIADAYEATPGERTSIDDLIAEVRAARVRTPGDEPIRVLTVHGAKGLEFDAVVLADLDGRLPGRPPGVLIDRDPADPTRPARAISLGCNEKTRALSPTLRAMHEDWKAGRILDELCLLYVAMTRAKRHLDIVVERDACDRATLSAVAWHGLEASGAGGIVAGDAAWLAEPPAEPAGTRPVPRWAKAVDLARPPERASWRAGVVRPSAGVDTVRGALGLADDAAVLGIEVHALLEGVDWLENAGEDPAEWPDAESRDSRAIEAVRRALARGELAAVLGRADFVRRWGPDLDLEVQRELPIANLLGEGVGATLVRGRIDRVVVGRRDGRAERCLVADFKTGRNPRSDGQLDLYARALSVRLGLPLDAIERRPVAVPV
ncbi:MAG: UvrD-helicase domain-containing protein [Planctomycetota bacterium]